MLNKHGIVAELQFINNVAKSRSENVLHEAKPLNMHIQTLIWLRLRAETEHILLDEKFIKPDKVRLLHFTLFV